MASKRADLEARIGGFSKPSKMPCVSWSTPAYRCQLGSKLAKLPGTTCSGCYARKGLYVMPDTRNAMERRWGVLQEALASPVAGAAFVDAFAQLLQLRFKSTTRRLANGQRVRDDGRVFRWHDSGDLQSPAHLGLLTAIAEAVPGIRFWLPTREVGHVVAFLRKGGVIPRNLAVRLSVPRLDAGPAGEVARLVREHPQVTASGVHSKGSEPVGFEDCIAYTQGGECRDCRACWDPSTLVSYPKH